ncbi:putative barnase/colicin E5 family endoribonuclease, partial [Campylobacter fetus]|nr:hypothetical protein [Campylobacter fetus]
NAIKKLLVEKQGQVAGAFQRKELGDIDLVWGEVDKKLNGYGLAKIEAKHLNDFANFNGANPTEKMINGISEIIEKGKVVSKNGVDTIIYKTNNRIYAVGLSKGWMGKGDNSWIITSYEKKNLKETVVGDSKAISANAKFNEIKSPISTNNDIIPQNSKFDNTPTFLSKYPKFIDDLKWDKALKFSSPPKSKEELKARQAFLNSFKILSPKEKIDIKIYLSKDKNH